MKKEKRIVAIDYGLARIGMAISDPRSIIATPLPTLLAEKRLEATVEKVVGTLHEIEEKYRCLVDCMVVGLPLLLSGKRSHITEEVELFIEKMRKKIDIPIIPWDERLSSVQAERVLREENLTRKKRSRAIDSVSAIVILQNYLDWKSQNPPLSE